MQTLLGIASDNSVTSFGYGAKTDEAYSCWDYSCSTSYGLVTSSGLQISMTKNNAKEVIITGVVALVIVGGIALAPSTGGSSLFVSGGILAGLAGA